MLMPSNFKVISTPIDKGPAGGKSASAGEKLRDSQCLTGVLVEEALALWESMWQDLAGNVTQGTFVDSKTARGKEPKCGWPEFLEKMFLLKHYLDYTKEYCKGKK